MALTLDAPALQDTIPEMMRAAVLCGLRDIRQFERPAHEVGVHGSLNIQLYGLDPHEATFG